MANKSTFSNNLTPIARTRILTDRNLVKQDEKGYNDSDIYFGFNNSEKIDNEFKILTIGSRDIDNPYFGGFFFFAGKFPDQYPFFPPYILAKTQGKHTRFHPNYYSCGKCCLSILGTWSGPPWTSCQNIGTTSQALKSLFIENPITQEPSWEKCTDTRAARYAAVVEYRTLEIAVLDILDNIPKGFEMFLPIVENKFIELYPQYIKKLDKLKTMNNTTIVSPIYNVNGSMTITYNINELYQKFNLKYEYLIQKLKVKDKISISDNLSLNSDNLSPISNNLSPISDNLDIVDNKSSTSCINNNSKKKKKCPNDSAKNYDVGYTKTSENDGNIWKIIEDVNKRKKWVIKQKNNK